MLTTLQITSVQALSDRASVAAANGVDAEDIAKVLLTQKAVLDNLLAKSSARMETRVKAWQRLCEVWDVRPWPITFWYQEKEFGIEVGTPTACQRAGLRVLMPSRTSSTPALH